MPTLGTSFLDFGVGVVKEMIDEEGCSFSGGFDTEIAERGGVSGSSMGPFDRHSLVNELLKVIGFNIWNDCENTRHDLVDALGLVNALVDVDDLGRRRARWIERIELLTRPVEDALEFAFLLLCITHENVRHRSCRWW